jgi:hypothetical protein
MALQTLNRSDKLTATRISTQLQDNAQQPLLRIGRFLKWAKIKRFGSLHIFPIIVQKSFLKIVTFPFK